MKAFAVILMFAASPLAAQSPAEAAQAAAKALIDASLQLDKAESARDRVKALTQTVQAYEAGLAAMRDGLRAAAIRERQLSLKLQSQEEEVAQLLGVLTSLERSAAPEAMLHPDGPVGAARAGMLLASVTPGLSSDVQQLRNDLAEVTALRALQESAADTLSDGLAGAQQARTDLSQAVADRTDLPVRFTEDEVKLAILISSTETLEGFANGLSEVAEGEPLTNPLPPIDARKGSLPLPVQGQILRRANEADAAGVSRPGLVLATSPQALAVSPTAATVRYSGPLLDYGLVVILEPQPDLLFVLAGLDQSFVEAGQVLPEGSPVGLMGADESPSGEGAGAGRTETLYIEVRQGDAPVNPLTWFASDKG